jgi:hypothetical protein
VPGFHLAGLDPDDVAREVGRAKELVEDRMGREVTSMAYPFGKPRSHFTSEVAEIVRDAGYRQAAAIVYRSVRSSDSPFAIPRFFVTQDPIELLADKILGRLDVLGAVQEKLPLWAARIVSPVDFRIPEA